MVDLNVVLMYLSTDKFDMEDRLVESLSGDGCGDGRG
jgi:hypothetical protein